MAEAPSIQSDATKVLPHLIIQTDAKHNLGQTQEATQESSDGSKYLPEVIINDCDADYHI